MDGKGMVNESLAERVAGRKAPHAFPVVDASVLDLQETHKAIRDDIKMNRMVYEFPSGFNKLSLFEECRALTMLEDFETMYDVTMQMLVGKDLRISMRGDDGILYKKCELHVVDRFQDLRGDNFIDKYPVVITWLTEFMAAELTKKYPLPGSETPPSTAAKTEKKPGVGRAHSTSRG